MQRSKCCMLSQTSIYLGESFQGARHQLHVVGLTECLYPVCWDPCSYWPRVRSPQGPHVANRQVSWSASDFSPRMQEFLETIALVKLPSRKLMMTCCTVKPRIWARRVNKHQQVAIIHKFKALIFTVGLQGLINAGGAVHWLESYCLAWISLPLFLKATSHMHLGVGFGFLWIREPLIKEMIMCWGQGLRNSLSSTRNQGSILFGALQQGQSLNFSLEGHFLGSMHPTYSTLPAVDCVFIPHAQKTSIIVLGT